MSGALEVFGLFGGSLRCFRALARSSILCEVKVQVAAMMVANSWVTTDYLLQHAQNTKIFDEEEISVDGDFREQPSPPTLSLCRMIFRFPSSELPKGLFQLCFATPGAA